MKSTKEVTGRSKKPEEQEGRRLRQGLCASGPDSVPERAETSTRSTDETATGRWRSEPDHRREQDSEEEIQRQQHCKRLRFFYTNADSIVNKFEEFKERSTRYDIVGIVESWATEQIGDAELQLDGFVMYRRDRIGVKGGGLLMYNCGQRLLSNSVR